MHADSAMHAARLVQLEGAILGLMREAAEDHDTHDGLRVTAYVDPDHGLSIDLEYMRGGMAVAGESL